jgi:hypothetical protein
MADASTPAAPSISLSSSFLAGLDQQHLPDLTLFLSILCTTTHNPIFLSSCKDPHAKDPTFTELGEPDDEAEGRAAVVLPCTRMLRYFLLAIRFFVWGEFWVLSFRKDVESRLRKVVFCFRSFWKQICCVCVCVSSSCGLGC